MKFTFRDIQEGAYNAKVLEIKQDQGPFGPFLRLTFTIVAGELKNYKFSGFVKPTDLKQSKFYRWVTHILGEQPPHDFDTNDLIGKHCRVLLSKVKDFYSVTDVYTENHALISFDAPLDSITVVRNTAKS
jgi:hypothetical protein